MDISVSLAPTIVGARTLLKSVGLPTEDLLESHLAHFLYVGTPAVPSALVGAEIFGEHALLRSLAVGDGMRDKGIGSLLVAHIERHARSQGVRQIYLLTSTAESFFARRGYTPLDRQLAPGPIQKTREFAALCPASSAFMAKVLDT